MTRAKLINEIEFRNIFNRTDFDALIAVSLPNVFYTSGALILTQIDIRDRLAMTVIPREGESILLVCNIEQSLAQSESWLKDVRAYVEFAQTPIELLADVLKEKGLDKSKLGIEKKYLTIEFYEEMQQLLPQATIEGCDWLFDEVRSIKTQGEIEKLCNVSLNTERSIISAFSETRAGMSEKDLLRTILAKLGQNGANDFRSILVASGERSYFARPRATDRKLEPGDIVRADIGGLFDGYITDVARTAVVGKANAKQEQVYQKLVKIQQQICEVIKPGLSAAEVYHFSKRAFEKEDLHISLPSVGHGVGIGGREFPILQAQETRLLRENMLLSLELTYLDMDLGGFELEDLVWIKSNGAEFMTDQASVAKLFVIRD